MDPAPSKYGETTWTLPVGRQLGQLGQRTESISGLGLPQIQGFGGEIQGGNPENPEPNSPDRSPLPAE